MKKLLLLIPLFLFCSCRDKSEPRDIAFFDKGKKVVWSTKCGYSIHFANIKDYSEKEILNIAEAMHYLCDGNARYSFEIYDNDGNIVYEIDCPDNYSLHTYKYTPLNPEEKHYDISEINITREGKSNYKIKKHENSESARETTQESHSEIKQYSYGDTFEVAGVQTEIVAESDLYMSLLTKKALSEKQIVELYKMVEKGQLKSVSNIYLFDYRCSSYMSGTDDYAALMPSMKSISMFRSNKSYTIQSNYSLKKI